MTRASRPTRPRSRLFPVLIALVIVGLALFVVQTSMSGGGTYSLAVGDLVGDAHAFVDRQVKVEGVIQPGSVRTGVDEFDIWFKVADEDGHAVEVHYTKVLPDPFKEGRSAIVEGVYTETGAIEASRLTVKCPSKYQSEDLSPEERARYFDQNPEHRPADGGATAPAAPARQ